VSEMSDKLKYISTRITSLLAGYRRGQRWWSVATHGATILVVAFSAVSGVLAQKTGSWFGISVADVATTLSIAIIVISTVQSKFGFERKWIANRMTRNAISLLDIDRNMGADADKLADALKSILVKHDQAITAT
jgi:hypothetical protein